MPVVGTTCLADTVWDEHGMPVELYRHDSVRYGDHLSRKWSLELHRQLISVISITVQPTEQHEYSLVLGQETFIFLYIRHQNHTNSQLCLP